MEIDCVRLFHRHDFAFWEYGDGGGVKDPFMDPGCICENRLSGQLVTVTGFQGRPPAKGRVDRRHRLKHFSQGLFDCERDSADAKSLLDADLSVSDDHC